MGVSGIEKNNEPKNIAIPNTKNNEIIPDKNLKLTKEEIDELYSYESAICKINFGTSGSGIGFFCEINDDEIPFKKALFTKYHILNKENIGINKEIKFEYCKEEKSIIITENRIVFTKRDLDYTCIEIFDTDKINKFFKIDENIINDKDSLKDKEIFILQYPSGELSHGSGTILDIKNNIISHSISIDKDSSGSPLIKRNNINLIIGMHIGGEDTGNFNNKIKYNFAIPFDIIIQDLINQLFNEFMTVNLIYEKTIDTNNNIFGEEFVNNNKENLILKINGIKSELIEEYNLKEGINNIQIIIKNKLINLKDMFHNVTSLKNIEELKHLNTEEVNDFSNMFYGCSSLSDIRPLENWNVSNGINFSNMFYGCSSLSDIKALEKWNVSNGNNFEGIFSFCSSLSDIKSLQNWNVSNVNNFSGMFKECSSLSNISSLQNWDVSNGNNFSEIFFNCASLSDINSLQNWNVSNGKDFSYIFFGCLSLSDINALQYWNVSNGNNFSDVFNGCSSLSNINALQYWDVSNGNIFTGMFSYCTSLYDIQSLQYWNVSNGYNFSKMFSECSLLSNIKALQNWDVSNGSDFSFMFDGCSLLYDIKALKYWDVSKGNNFRNIFHGCSSLSDIKIKQNLDIPISNNYANIING